MRTESTLATARGPVTIIHDACPTDVDAFSISPDLDSIVRGPAVRRAVFQKLAADPEARLTLAVAEGVIAGRAAVAPSFGRWRRLPAVREFAVEVARPWRRGTCLAATLVRTALADPRIEEEILLAFALPAAWDLESRPVSPAVYRRALGLVMAGRGFTPVGTDEPEVIGTASGTLAVRAGARVPPDAVAAFERSRYLGPGNASDGRNSGSPARAVRTLTARLRRMLRAA